MTDGKAVQMQEAAKLRNAMDQKVKAIRRNTAWRSTDRAVGRRVLKSKWVYKVKDGLDENGNNTHRHKARLCFMGTRQNKGLNFNDTFARVAKSTSIRFILALTAARVWELQQMDV